MLRGKKKIAIILAVALIALLFVAYYFPGRVYEKDETEPLYKLCKVWGYAKYNHPAFYEGSKKWDKEFIPLVIKIRASDNDDEVNRILNEWVVSLGKAEGEREEYPSWINDEFLGNELSKNLKNLHAADKKSVMNSPVFYKEGLPSFAHEEKYDWNTMRFSDKNWCLLGLFRIWNAIEYFCPDIDNSWDDALLEAIPRMLTAAEGKTRTEISSSYYRTIAEMVSKLDDPQASVMITDFFYKEEIGKNALPAVIRREGDSFVLEKVLEPDRPIKEGDVILKLDGKTIPEILEERRPYIGFKDDFSNVEKYLYILLSTNKEYCETEILRDGEILDLSVKTKEYYYLNFDLEEEPKENISYLNAENADPVSLKNAVTDTSKDGLVIDMRNGISDSFKNLLSCFDDCDRIYRLMTFKEEEPGQFEIVSKSYDTAPSNFKYQKPVCVLIDRNTAGDAELLAYIMSKNPQLTLVGEKSAGDAGAYANISVPGGGWVSFKGNRFLKSDGNEIIPIEPDIICHRDDAFREAVAFIKN